MFFTSTAEFYGVGHRLGKNLDSISLACVTLIALLEFWRPGDSSSGRTTDSESVSIGSIPISPAIIPTHASCSNPYNVCMPKKGFTSYTVGWLATFANLLVKSPVQPLQNTFDYGSRATVREFWLFFIFWGNLVPVLLSYYISGFFGIDLFDYYVDVIVMIPYISLAVRRLHDVGWSGKWVILTEGSWYLLMVIAALFVTGLAQVLLETFLLLSHIVMALVVYGRKGHQGHNQYGEQPYDYV